MAAHRQRWAWVIAAVAAGALAGGLARLLGAGPLRVEAPWLGALVGLFVFGLRFVRLRPAGPPGPRDAAPGPRARAALLLVFGVWAAAGSVAAARQAVRGYRPLDPEAVRPGSPPLEPGFYAATGRAQLGALYRMSGSEGDRFLFPLDAYEGRLLVVTTDRPPETFIRATGRLRDDLKTVLQSPEGRPEGAFLPRYRAHVGLPPGDPVYILDTSIRAGLNVRSLLHVAAPLYLFLLTLGVPVRRQAPPRARGVI